MKAVVLAGLLLAGCGSSDSKSEDSKPTTWSDNTRFGIIDGCVSSTQKDRPDLALGAVQTYCACMTEELQKKYSEEDFKAHATEYAATAKTDGTVVTCKSRAGIAN